MSVKVGVIMGSDSDWPIMEGAVDALKTLGVPVEATVVSAHRTPERLMEYASSARNRGLDVIIAGAGGAAHLPGMIAAVTELPVIGVPVVATCLNGEDSLLSIVQMPKGVPVATVATGDHALRDRLADYKQQLAAQVVEKAKKVERAAN
jgi:5-(carboxyamino)imidazole ribonucleotide mutase